MKTKSAVVTTLLFLSFLALPTPASAETKKSKPTTVSTSSPSAKKDKVEKVKCRTTRAVAQSPARVLPPTSLLKKFEEDGLIKNLSRSITLGVTPYKTLKRILNDSSVPFAS